MTQRITLRQQDGLATLTLSRPEKLNALDTQAFEELDAHLAMIEGATDLIGCVVLQGSGKHFCAGADLGAIAAAPATSKPAVIARLAALPQPTLAAVHGVCFTGALELALACDFIIADRSARFADTHGKWGLVGAWGMIQRLPRRIGAANAKRMMFTSREVDAAEAEHLGLIDMLVDEGRLNDAVRRLAAEILANSWHTNMHSKRIMRETEGMSLAAALAWEQFNYPGYARDHEDRVSRFLKTT